ncbi:MAG: lipoprotein insertase outer membrane protein LolB [Candidatus Accumulibacter sp.]|jgi:outer membrane lipoprotein LolB|nr:lipoprotein insertase outer membrane protein LolB [Accumulibacter sp.]
MGDGASLSAGLAALRRRVLPFLTALFLCACAAFPPSSRHAEPGRRAGIPAGFSIEARFSFRHEERNYYGRISWRRVGASDALLLSSSFGQGMAEMNVDENGARLVLSDGKTQEAPNAETLMNRVLGYPLSIERLAGWVFGRGKSEGKDEEADDADTDALGRIVRLRLDGWIVDYTYARDDATAPPSRIHAAHADGNAEIRLAIEDWHEAAAPENRARPDPASGQ